MHAASVLRAAVMHRLRVERMPWSSSHFEVRETERGSGAADADAVVDKEWRRLPGWELVSTAY